MMAIRFPPRETGGSGLPAIYVDSSHRFDHFGSPARSSLPQSNFSPALSSSTPMSIPNRRAPEDDAPPPLPPPKFPFQPQQPHAPPIDHQPAPASSLDSIGSWSGSFSKREHPVQQKDEGYSSLTSAGSGSLLRNSKDSYPRFMSHDHFQFTQPKTDYDSSVLKKLDPRRTLDHHSPPRKSGLSSSTSDPMQRYPATEARLHPQPPPLSLPIRPASERYIDSPGRLTETPIQSVASSHTMSLLGASSSEHRSPIEPMDMDRSPLLRSRRANSGSQADDTASSTHSSMDHYREDSVPLDPSGMRRLRIDDSLLRPDGLVIGQKRRASSPPGDDAPMQGLSNSTDLLRRREGASRASPTPRLAIIPQATIPPESLAPRGGPYVSSVAITASNIPSMNSYGRKSPSGVSPVDICNSPFNNPVSLSPRVSLTRPTHQRNVSGEHRQLASPRKVSDMAKSSMSKIQGGYFMCECCPKKPKKFETDEELRAHEAEKQYECSFCGSRFKNKNEAERHQNSLHVRRHSWSCSALHRNGYDRAFHESSSRPGEADACGYCGEEFTRSGGAGRARRPTEQDWEERVRHLQEVHKFRECNSSKKFFRADHFRQHLKHSHAGTSGKWTNMLETACMLDEEPPQPR